LVVSVSVFVAVVANVPLAPVAGAVKTTKAPLTGDPPMVTVATIGAAKAVLRAALCGVPLVAAMDSVGGLKLELLQPARKAEKINAKLNATMPAYLRRRMATRAAGCRCLRLN
jgi:hypothetical protein